MTPAQFKSILRDSDGAGPHECLHADVEDIRQAAEELEFSYARVVLTSPADMEQFFDAMQRELQLPKWFRRNWNGLADCLTDLSWRRAAGHVVVVEGFETWANANGLEFDIGLSVFGEAAEFWREDDIPLWSVFAVAEGNKQFLPRFS